jgi:hypothetical protein
MACHVPTKILLHNASKDQQLDGKTFLFTSLFGVEVKFECRGCDGTEHRGQRLEQRPRLVSCQLIWKKAAGKGARCKLVVAQKFFLYDSLDRAAFLLQLKKKQN